MANTKVKNELFRIAVRSGDRFRQWLYTAKHDFRPDLDEIINEARPRAEYPTPADIADLIYRENC